MRMPFFNCQSPLRHFLFRQPTVKRGIYIHSMMRLFRSTIEKKGLKWPPIFYSCAAQPLESSWISRSRRPRCVSERHWKPRQLNSKRQRDRMLLMRSLRFFVSLMLVSTFCGISCFLTFNLWTFLAYCSSQGIKDSLREIPLDCVTILTPRRTSPCHLSRAIV